MYQDIKEFFFIIAPIVGIFFATILIMMLIKLMEYVSKITI